MNIPTKFVNELSEEQREELRDLMKTSNEQVRRRAHAVLLSSRGSSVDRIADLYEVSRDPVNRWLDRWEDAGTGGLHDPEGRGRKPSGAKASRLPGGAETRGSGSGASTGIRWELEVGLISRSRPC